MTGTDLRAALGRLGWGPTRAGAECGVSSRTVANWLIDKHRIPALAQRHVLAAIAALGSDTRGGGK
jgi:hypothetical protein